MVISKINLEPVMPGFEEVPTKHLIGARGLPDLSYVDRLQNGVRRSATDLEWGVAIARDARLAQTIGIVLRRGQQNALYQRWENMRPGSTQLVRDLSRYHFIPPVTSVA